MRRESSRLGEIGLIYLIKQIAWGFNFEMSSGGVVAVVSLSGTTYPPLLLVCVLENFPHFFFLFSIFWVGKH